MKFCKCTILTLVFTSIAMLGQSAETDKPANPNTLAAAIPWADVIEPDFPFFSSVLDARKLGGGWPTNNLTPRGLILNLGRGTWACFDIDLLRMSAIWVGKGVTPVSMSQGSYHVAGAKAPQGQETLPQIVGKPWLATGIYPGWQSGDAISLVDPRESLKDEREIGRGPLPRSLGQFRAVRLVRGGVCLEYEVAGANIRETVQASSLEGERTVRRSFVISKAEQPLNLVLGHRTNDKLLISIGHGKNSGPAPRLVQQDDGIFVVQIAPAREPISFDVSISEAVHPTLALAEADLSLPGIRWNQILVTSVTNTVTTGAKDAYMLENISLPLRNRWKRNVRLADLAFFRNGRAAAVTFDGDVWLIVGLSGDLRKVKWKRYASGFHEPMGICVRGDGLFVNDRNGIWRLRDTDNNGEADVHELFCNAFGQTAETREFASGLRVAPDGSFVISKGGQQGSTLGKHNGTVLRISPDGQNVSVVGWGLRQPFIGVNPETGLITASDQQGHYVPATPLHIIRDNRYYGFLSGQLPKEVYPAPIADPLTWIPHPINASGASQVWLTGAKMGPLNNALIHIGYNRPEIFLVLTNERAARLQGAVISLAQNFEFSPLNGAVNPLDGQLYLIGFQIWGTTANQVSGLARLKYTDAPSTLPREIAAMDKGILLRFEHPLDPAKATNTANFSAERWNYKRTANYGSPHYKLDGSKGQDPLTPSSAYLSKDGKTIFIGIPDMRPVMQMRFGWSLALQDGVPFDKNAYFTPYELTAFDPVKEGFEALTVDLTPKALHAAAESPVTAEEGKRLSELMGCAACHSADGTLLGKVGPTWKGLFGSERSFADGTKAMADESYLRQSIREPAAKVVSGFDKSDTGMPSYDGIISDSQLEALLLYIKTLK